MFSYSMLSTFPQKSIPQSRVELSKIWWKLQRTITVNILQSLHLAHLLEQHVKIEQGISGI
jgi:hypothetical protein